jgi:hypothetical protein
VRSFLLFVVSLAVFVAVGAFARTLIGAEVGEPCSELLLSCRATRGILTVNACVRTGPGDDETFCSYACEADDECPEGWSCDAAGAWSNVPGALEDVQRVCRRPE